MGSSAPPPISNAAAPSMPGLRRVLEAIEDRLDIKGRCRISLHSLNAADRTFRVIDYVGTSLFENGVVLPIPAATQIAIPAAGDVYGENHLSDDPRFDRELDRVIKHLGFTSSCSVPLLLGRTPVGVLCVSSRRTAVHPGEVLACVDSFGPDLTLAAQESTRSASPPVALICHQDAIVGDWVSRVLNDRFGYTSMTFDSAEVATDFVRASSVPVQLVVCESFFGEIGLPGFIGRLRALRPHAPVMIMASSDSPLSVELARRSGADAYVARKAGVDGLIAAIDGCRSGFPVALGRATDDDRSTPLTRQECILLLRLEEGKTFAQIAREMRISVATAKGYARSLFAKFSAHSRAETVFEARRLGVIDYLRAGGSAAFVPAGK